MSDHITLVGNIVGDLEQRTTRDGGTVAAFRLAVGERRLDRERGEWVDAHTSFYAVSIFGELGAHALRSFQKGQRVIVDGRLRLREWETENRRGVSADVTAEAVGHDLRWGITHFTRTPKPGSDAATGAAVVAAATAVSTEEAPGSAPSSDADGWALPGASEAPVHVETAEAAAGSPAQREPVETPF